MSNGRSREISEAIQAANEALEHLEAAERELDSAGRWGMFDMFAGGMLSSFVKHSRLGTAQDEIDAAKRALKRFARELRDVDESGGLNVEVGGFLGFADIFMDNIVADWLVQAKIDAAKRQVAEAIEQVTRVRDSLCRL